MRAYLIMYNYFNTVKMRKLLILLLLFPIFLNAQNESKYMEGAVPIVNGKVVFTRYLNVADFSQQQIYNALIDWASRNFTQGNARVILSDPETGTIVVQNQNEIIARIGIFPAKVKMASVIKMICSEGNCMIETSRIRYTNNPTSKTPNEIITAEEYITDQYAMNKAKTKVFKGIGDYRKSTIDIVDKTAVDAQAAVYTYHDTALANHAQTMANIPAPVAQHQLTAQPVQPAQSAQQPTQQPTQQPAQQSAQQPAQQPAQPAQSATVVNQQPQQTIPASTQQQATTAVPGEQIAIAGDIAQKLSNGEYAGYITAVEGKPLKKAVKGETGLDLNGTRPSISFEIVEDTDNIKFIMEMANRFTVTIFRSDDDAMESPVTIIDCNKAQQFNNLFIGEITGARTK